MRILVIAPEPLFPPRSGIGKRSLQFVHYLVRKHDVDLLTLQIAGNNSLIATSDPEFGADLEGRCRSSVVVEDETSRMQLRYGFVWQSERLEREIQRMLRGNNHDAILGFSSVMPFYLADISDRPVVIDINDADDIAWRGTLRHGGSMRNRLRAARNLLLFPFYRRHFLSRVRDLVVVSADDGEHLRRSLPKSRIHVVPLTPEPCFFEPIEISPEPNTILFHGNLGAVHNAEAARYLMTEIFPRVEKVLPNARLILAGPNAPLNLERRARIMPNVRLLGHIPDIRDVLRRAAVFACAHRSGSGVKTKCPVPRKCPQLMI
jgi:hypothetical protein